MNLALIGYGAIGQAVAAALPEAQLGILTRTPRPLPGGAVALPDLGALLGFNPDLVVEAAGQDAARVLVPEVLRHGRDVLMASVGAMADPQTEAAMRAAPRDGAHLLIPAGAIGGIDLVAALDKSKLRAVRYTGSKPPAAWAGSPAAEGRDLSRLSEPVVLFEGSAREAALRFPKNANVAATLALAGAGFDDTEARLVADPSARGNRHAYTVEADGAEVRFEVTALPDPSNPGTSATTALSLIRAIRNRTDAIVI
ncbi:aspartate dehydrogenase [Tropicimonas sp. S265A]|uniref:aspartate dehydrogenase n=1 Tax=Tropicimonas sp. S265A TaxID=3415134 RepID=UPI003C7BF7F9